MKKKYLLLALPVLFGCGGDEHEDLQQWMQNQSKDLKGHVKPIPEIKPYEPVDYGASLLQSPFDPARIESESKKSGGSNANNGPDIDAREQRNSILEKYPLESMTMIGYMNINNTPMAAIQFDQVVKQVRVGDYIGIDFGKIIEINDQEVVIEELVEDTVGEWGGRTSTLRLQSREDKK